MEKFFEKMPKRGIFDLKIFRSGILIEEIHDDNLIVDGAKDQMAHLLIGETEGRNINRIAFGTNGIEPEPSDTAITDPFIKNIGVIFTLPKSGRAVFEWRLLETENNGMAIMEFGLLTADGTLFARRSRQNPIHKASDISLEGSWTIIF